MVHLLKGEIQQMNAVTFHLLSGEILLMNAVNGSPVE